MAKLYKNAVISPEELFLNQPVVVEATVVPEEIMTPVDESVLENAQQESYDQGYAAGVIEGRTVVAQEFSQLKEQLAAALASIPQAIAQNRLDLSSEVADIVLLITQQFFIERQKDPKALTQQINQVLSQLNNKQTVELCLHPQEITALQNGMIQLDAAHLNGLKIKGDESLTLGGYVIKTEHGIFDASIEKQIDKLKEVLMQLKHRGQHAPLA
jgi:flagellar assembly protein FliH